MPLFARHFTVRQARDELRAVRPLLARAAELIADLQETVRLDVSRIQQLVASNGHGVKHPEYGKQVAELQRIVQDITGRGVEVKDLARGLIDFPHWRDGEEVYLCYLHGEPDIEYWHSLEGGFAARRPL